MDLYANKNIKISKNAISGEETLILYEKHSNNIAGVNLKKDFLNKKFYSTTATFNTNLKTNDNLKKG
jgi:hypothetical protein